MPTSQRYPVAPGTHEDIAVEELRLPAHLATPEIVARREPVVRQLDAMVRRLLQRNAPGMFAVVHPVTVYDAVYPATPEIGGHWTVTSTWMGPLTHTISSYSVALAFDDQQRPDHFIVSGAREIETDDVSEAALAGALASARAFGPLVTTAPHMFQGFGL